MNDTPHLSAAILRLLDESPETRGTTMFCHVAVAKLAALADLLRREWNAELILLVANDRRQDLGSFEIHYLFSSRRNNGFIHVTCVLPSGSQSISSLATFSFPASRFEREIHDLFGIEPTGHPDLRPLVRHAFWPEDYFPMRRDAKFPEGLEDDGTPFPFMPVGGEGVYEIPVGPVHAGIIEPGHFRFSVLGETVIDLKIRLYFTHKGTEKLFEGRHPAQAVELAERISGDTTVGHSLAYCHALEALAEIEAPARAQHLRVILLELERLYNHIADFGAVCNDAAFSFAYSHCLRLRERLLRINKRLTGSRLLRGALIPGGVRCELPPEMDLARELREILADFEETVSISLRTTTLVDRLEETGRLTTQTATDYGALGFVARASGIDRDARRDHPFDAYKTLRFQVPVFSSGDVYARTMVRVKEAAQSVSLIAQALKQMPAGPLSATLGPLAAFQPAFGFTEGWRGMIIHWVMVDPDGRLYRVKVKDPSFANWPALSLALLKNIVPDFPLCNKSFNQSYSGNDL